MLIAAVERDDLTSVQQLLDRGADPDTKLEDSPLVHRAAICGQCEILRAILKAGADIDAKNTAGLSAIMCFAVFGCNTTEQKRALEILLGAGADLNLEHEVGKRNALDMAIMMKRSELARRLSTAGGRTSTDELQRAQHRLLDNGRTR